MRSQATSGNQHQIGGRGQRLGRPGGGLADAEAVCNQRIAGAPAVKGHGLGRRDTRQGEGPLRVVEQQVERNFTALGAVGEDGGVIRQRVHEPADARGDGGFRRASFAVVERLAPGLVAGAQRLPVVGTHGVAAPTVGGGDGNKKGRR